MYLIHTADLHLDSSFESEYPVEKARLRRTELCENFLRIVNYAAAYHVRAILIAGDLFDGDALLSSTRERIYTAMTAHPELDFYYLRGNHDRAAPCDFPSNFHIFGDRFTSYELGENVRLYGCVSPTEDDYAALCPASAETNIVMLHGTAVESGFTGDTVNLPALRHKNIDYLALGHLHTAREDKLDARGVYAYSGMPEGRFFDEAGQKGFYLLRVENGKIDRRFLTTAARTVHTVAPAFKAGDTAESAARTVEEALRAIPGKDIVRIELPTDCPLPAYIAENAIRDRFFYGDVKVTGRRSTDDASLYRGDISLRGEFVRLVEDSDLTEDEKAAVLHYGLAALRGEEADAL